MHAQGIPADKSLTLLKAGNYSYVATGESSGNISPAQRLHTAEEGQHLYAVVITCSDSRVVPEVVFSAGIGDLFVIRVAGNVIDSHQLGSIEYAAEHLGCRLVLVLGHTHCGAVDAAIAGNSEGYIKYIVEEIQEAIGQEKDPYEACHHNVRHSMHVIENSLKIQAVEHDYGVKVMGAIYDIETGKVDFLQDNLRQF